jgi:glycosyltransferase involved in cell wall biosynthesis
MTRPVLTVLIDTYNYGHFIEQAIESVLSQDFPMDQTEILVVDDGSTDDTAERLKKYGSRIQYVYKPNGGQASAFNLGFAHARGEIVILLDADDYFLPGKLGEVAIAFQQNPQAGLIYHRLLELHAGSDELRDWDMTLVSGFIPDDIEKLLKFAPYPTSCLAFRRSLVNQLLPIPESLRLQADGYITLLAALLAPVVALQQSLAVYRIHGKNMYYLSDSAVTVDQRRSRVESNILVLREVAVWTRAHRDRVKSSRARLFFGHRLLHCEEQKFQIDSPGRLRYFWFLIRQNYALGPLQTWKFTAFNYLAACSALLFGYRKAESLHRNRLKVVTAAQSIFKH